MQTPSRFAWSVWIGFSHSVQIFHCPLGFWYADKDITIEWTECFNLGNLRQIVS